MLITHHDIFSSLLGKSIRIICDDTDMFVLPLHYLSSRSEDRSNA